jgi:hypothetical protein
MGTLRRKMPAQQFVFFRERRTVGIVDAIDFMLSEYPPEEQEYRSCPPSDVVLRQAVQVVITYTDARPDRMNENFKKLVLEAIHDACFLPTAPATCSAGSRETGGICDVDRTR